MVWPLQGPSSGSFTGPTDHLWSHVQASTSRCGVSPVWVASFGCVETPCPSGSQAGPVRRWATKEGWELPVSAGCSGRVWLRKLGPRKWSRYSKVPRHDTGASDRRTSLSPSFPHHKVSHLSAGRRGSLSPPLCSPVFTCSSWSALYKILLFSGKDCAIRKNNGFPYFLVNSVPNTQQVSTNLSNYYYCYCCSYFSANLFIKVLILRIKGSKGNISFGLICPRGSEEFVWAHPRTDRGRSSGSGWCPNSAVAR